MVLFGVESSNQETLDKINKGVKVEDIIPTLKKASEAGLEPHICVIFGHPNETDKDALNTVALTHYLLRKGYAKQPKRLSMMLKKKVEMKIIENMSIKSIKQGGTWTSGLIS